MAAEKNFENKIKKYLTDHGAWFIKYWAGPKFTKEGIPDILACIQGKFFAIEVKAPKGKPTLIQIVTLRNIRKSGGIGVLLYPEDWIGFREFIEKDKKDWYLSNISKQNDWFKKLMD